MEDDEEEETMEELLGLRSSYFATPVFIVYIRLWSRSPKTLIIIGHIIEGL